MRRHRTRKDGPTERRPVAPRDRPPSRPEGLPLPPQSAASGRAARRRWSPTPSGQESTDLA
jgi:hypothetical protein